MVAVEKIAVSNLSTSYPVGRGRHRGPTGGGGFWGGSGLWGGGGGGRGGDGGEGGKGGKGGYGGKGGKGGDGGKGGQGCQGSGGSSSESNTLDELFVQYFPSHSKPSQHFEKGGVPFPQTPSA